MNGILEAVYNHWAENSHDSYEINQIYEMLVKPVKGDVKKENELYFVYAEAVGKEQQNAFYAGFYSAVELLVTRGGKV